MAGNTWLSTSTNIFFSSFSVKSMFLVIFERHEEHVYSLLYTLNYYEKNCILCRNTVWANNFNPPTVKLKTFYFLNIILRDEFKRHLNSEQSVLLTQNVIRFPYDAMYVSHETYTAYIGPGTVILNNLQCPCICPLEPTQSPIQWVQWAFRCG